jgi:hypothetical protein
MFRPLLLVMLAACGSNEPAADAPKSLEEQAAEKCPRVGMDRLGGAYIAATGNPKTRMWVEKRGAETLLWYTDPAFSNHRLEMVGTKRDKDWQFDERPRGKRAKMIAEGSEAKKRVYLQPTLKNCRLEVYPGAVDAAGKEQMPTKPKAFAEFPDSGGVVFSFAPFDETLFLGEAAKDKAVADKQVEELGEPQIDHPMGEVTVAAWTDATGDGGDGCTFAYDAFFDGQRVEGGEAQPAGDVVDGQRPWRHTFKAPYTGNHTFEIHRYKTCGGKKELIAVAGLDAVLQ